MDAQRYRESLRELDRTICDFGERIDGVVDHPLTKPHVNAAAMTFEPAHRPEHEDLMTLTSSLHGGELTTPPMSLLSGKQAEGGSGGG